MITIYISMIIKSERYREWWIENHNFAICGHTTTTNTMHLNRAYYAYPSQVMF